MSEELKIAIVGRAPSSDLQAPFDDPTWEMWTLSNGVSCGRVPRSTRHFELHPLEWIDARRDGYTQWMTEHTSGRMYLREANEKVPNSEVFPWERLVELYGGYFNNTVSWMICYALHCGATHISIYGVDMAADTEYDKQRPSCEFWLGVAIGRGVKVHVPTESDLLKVRKLYGIEFDGGDFYGKWKQRNDELAIQHRDAMALAEHHKLRAAHLEGQQANQRYMAQWIE